MNVETSAWNTDQFLKDTQMVRYISRVIFWYDAVSNNERKNLSYLENDVLFCQFFHHKFHMAYPGIEIRPVW